jgi:RNA polymerase sigma-B factor
MTAVTAPAPAGTSRRRTFEDAPQTARDFVRFAALPDGPEREALQEVLVTAWLPMAHRLAVKYRNRGEQLEDLKQVAAVGLMKAVDRYDPEQGRAFEAYAVPTIMGELKRHFRDRTWDLHVPRRVQDLRNKVRRAMRELTNTMGDRSPTVQQIAAQAEISEEDVLTGMEAIDSFRSLSLEAQMTNTGEGNYSLLDTLGATDDSYDAVVYRETVKPEIAKLPERERHILYLRFFRDMTQSKIGEELGISQMHVSRLLSGACGRIRRAVERDPAVRQPAGVAA